MKKLLLATFTFISLLATAQNDSTLCSRITKKVDDFTNAIKWMTPFTLDGIKECAVRLYKIKSEGNPFDYILCLNTSGITLNVKKSGVIILFTDGTKMTQPTEVNAKVGDDVDKWKYNAKVWLSSEDLEILSKKTIKKFRLYIYDQDVDQNQATEFRAFVNCIMNSK